MHKHQHSSSPFSTAPGFSFLCLCFLTILWNEVFFWDGDGPDIAKKEQRKKRAWKCYVMESIMFFGFNKREPILNNTSANMLLQTGAVWYHGWDERILNSHLSLFTGRKEKKRSSLCFYSHLCRFWRHPLEQRSCLSSSSLRQRPPSYQMSLGYTVAGC